MKTKEEILAKYYGRTEPWTKELLEHNKEVLAAMEEYAQQSTLSESKVMEVLNKHLFILEDPDLIDDMHKDICKLSVLGVSEEEIIELWKKHKGKYNVIFNRKDFWKFIKELSKND